MNHSPATDESRWKARPARAVRQLLEAGSQPASALVPLSSEARDGAAWRRLRALHALVLLAVLFNLWSLRFERLSVAYPNDNGMHLQMTTTAMNLLRH